MGDIKVSDIKAPVDLRKLVRLVEDIRVDKEINDPENIKRVQDGDLFVSKKLEGAETLPKAIKVPAEGLLLRYEGVKIVVRDNEADVFIYRPGAKDPKKLDHHIWKADELKDTLSKLDRSMRTVGFSAVGGEDFPKQYQNKDIEKSCLRVAFAEEGLRKSTAFFTISRKDEWVDWGRDLKRILKIYEALEDFSKHGFDAKSGKELDLEKMTKEQKQKFLQAKNYLESLQANSKLFFRVDKKANLKVVVNDDQVLISMDANPAGMRVVPKTIQFLSTDSKTVLHELPKEKISAIVKDMEKYFVDKKFEYKEELAMQKDHNLEFGSFSYDQMNVIKGMTFKPKKDGKTLPLVFMTRDLYK